MAMTDMIGVLGDLGEFLGSIAVLATLVYLAVQTRNINRQSQAEARYAFVDAMADINIAIGQSKEAASVWRRGLQSVDSLDEDERMQFIMFVGQYANTWAVMHQLHEDGLLPEAQWQVVRNDIASILASPGGRQFWRVGGEAAFGERFVAFVNRELAAGAQPYDMARMAMAQDSAR